MNHLATTKDDIKESAVFLTYRGNEKCKENIWYLDTGAINHMCGQIGLFTNLDDTIREEVTFGDLSKVAVEGIGKVMVTLQDGGQKCIRAGFKEQYEWYLEFFSLPIKY